MTASRLRLPRVRLPRVPLPDVLGALGRRWDRTPWYARYVGYALLVVGAILLPSDAIGSFMTPQSDWASVLFYPIGVYVLLAIGLNVVVGQAGLLDLGYVAFFAIGGYTMAILATNHGWSFWEVLPAAVVVAALSGLILGTPTLRLRGDYLAIVTLGFGEIVRISANNAGGFTGGPRGISPIPHPPSVSGVDALTYGVIDPPPARILGLELHVAPYYYLVVALIVLAIVLVKRLERSRVGRAWAAIREDEDAAEVMGVPTLRYKLWAFVIGASIGGVTGVLFASQQISITPGNFPFILSALILCAVVLGGSGNILGVVLGAFLIAWLPERFRQFADYRDLFFGGALVLIMIIRPEGLLPSRRRRAELAEGTGGMGALGGEVDRGQLPAGPTAGADPGADPDSTRVRR